jgi:hypothetical protein
MAKPKEETKGIRQLIPSAESQFKILQYVGGVLQEHRKYTDYHTKMEAIDIAYARYISNLDPDTGVARGEGIDAATQPVGVVNMPSTCPPVVVSQVDSMVAYLADVFLSGYPLFPVVSNPLNKKYAEQLETLMDDHATLGGYARQFLMFFKDGVKYNLSALECDWTAIEQYSSMDDMLDPGKKKLQRDNKSFNKVSRLDPYNTIWDKTVAPGDVSTDGDYAGYVNIKSRTKIKRILNRWSNDQEAFNVREALATTSTEDSIYHMAPQISNYITARKPTTGMNWAVWMTGKDFQESTVSVGDNFEIITLYARIIPHDFGLSVPMQNTPQIWKFVTINQKVLVQAKRVISAYDMLPILFGQPLEDGLGYQTQSIAEANIPFQEAAKTLFNIRFNSARRAVADRALYNPDLINSADINAPVPAAKIPVKANRLDKRPLSDAYHQIPFDARGTESAIQDGMTIVNFGKELSGLNSPMQGQFQKGNKSVKEWNDTMGGADARLRMPALTLEFQVFMPLKELIKLNIFQYGDDAEVISQKDGSIIQVKLTELRSKVLAFRVADGYTPKSKLAGTESLTNLIQMLAQSQPLQVAYGPMLPSIFAHLAQLMGVRGLEEYDPRRQQEEAMEGSASNPAEESLEPPTSQVPMQGQASR